MFDVEIEVPRLTQFMGYSALTSMPNEHPRWGHYSATYMDQCQAAFETWVKEYTEAVLHQERVRVAWENAK